MVVRDVFIISGLVAWFGGLFFQYESPFLVGRFSKKTRTRIFGLSWVLVFGGAALALFGALVFKG